MQQNARKVAERIEEQEIARAAAALSEPAFQAIWNNREDDVYDAAFAHL